MARRTAAIAAGVLLSAVAVGTIAGAAGRSGAPSHEPGAGATAEQKPASASTDGVHSGAGAGPPASRAPSAIGPDGDPSELRDAVPEELRPALDAAEDLLRRELARRPLRPGSEPRVLRSTAGRHPRHRGWVVALITWEPVLGGEPSSTPVTTRLVMAPDGGAWRPVPVWEEAGS